MDASAVQPCIDYEDEFFNLEYILKKNPESLVFLQNYKSGEERPLTEDERNLISEIIIDWILKKGIVLRRVDYLLIFDKIKAVFPREISVTWYKPPLSKRGKKQERIQRKQDTEIRNDGKEDSVKKTTVWSGPGGSLYNGWRTKIQKKRRNAKKRGQFIYHLYIEMLLLLLRSQTMQKRLMKTKYKLSNGFPLTLTPGAK